MFVVAMTQSIFFLYLCVSRELIAYVEKENEDQEWKGYVFAVGCLLWL